MRISPTKQIEHLRVMTGPMRSDKSFGANGAFMIPFMNDPKRPILRVIASDGSDWAECGFPKPAWEHVSVSLESRCPTWQEMDYIKRIFWRDNETVLQLHVPRDQHVNCHEHCLHLWKPIGVEIPLPPSMTVGPQNSLRR